MAATQGGFGFLDPETDAFTTIADPEANRIDAVMNDGRAGPGGQFFTGSMGFPIRLDKTDNTLLALRS